MDAEQTVAATKVVIEKAERTALGQRYQPDGEFGEFDRQWVQVHTVEAALGDEAAGDHGARLGVAGQRFFGVRRIQHFAIHAHRLSTNFGQ